MNLTNTNPPSAKYLKDYTKPAFSIYDIYLEFDLKATQTQVHATSKVKRNFSDNKPILGALVLDGIDLDLLSINIDGQAFDDFQLLNEQLIINIDRDEFELCIVTEISPATNSSLEGLYLSGGAYCTQCEAEGFRKITYYQDRPDVLATFTVKITADKKYPYLLSNGNKIEQGELEDGRHYTVWQDPFKKPAYLFALVAGDFDVLKDSYKTMSGREVELALFVDKGNLNKASHALTSLKKSMKWDEDTFGLEYDLDIYMIVAVDFFNMGAMENKGLNVFNSKCVLANQATATDSDYHMIESIIGHEYFHNWTGNRVTCRDWFQLSLKEGLTVFRDQEFSSDLGSRAINRIAAVKAMRTHQFAEDAGPMAHPIRPEQVIEMNNFYTVTVYNKGAEVIRMMHTLLGKENFRKGMDLYFERHDGQAVTCDDFVNAMMQASSIDLTQFKHWYSQSGTPKLVVKEKFDKTSGVYQLEINQVHTATADQDKKHNLHIPFSIELLDQDGKVLQLTYEGNVICKVLNVTQGKQVFSFDNIKTKPTPILLEDFSAPCQLDFNYSDEQLCHIVRHASSDFSRWDAQQMLLIKNIKAAVKNDNIDLPKNITELISDILLDNTIDLELAAQLIKLPSYDVIAAEYEEVPINSIIEAIDSFEQQIAQTLNTVLFDVYNKLNENSVNECENLSTEVVGKRALKNACLHYLAKQNEICMVEALNAQLEMINMTDSLAALSSAVHANHELSQSMLIAFESKWEKDALVMDKWFGLQAMQDKPDIVAHLQSLYSHSHFDYANPNRVRALIGSFTHFNIKQFHNENGSGYKLLTDLLIKLNDINPQNASRMITPLMSWQKYNVKRQKLIKQQLERLADIEDLSSDLYEKVSKALN
ncbi:aminopeptidase N [Pseudoalteromonas denitrificans]|uniref:Aminopeptidase N n=1 Tax=Pseudoalteromonas denitrificans DSM 6059 TaxID=1123010 RepID=A0A1I1G9L9_9GAMM|nr:aminopeptidase N [Pseudoalteromonas denitrificans]SFC08264.1 aminopeptidase N [Pseudoalteromonas denitrificans DSM 6059]